MRCATHPTVSYYLFCIDF